MSSTPVLYLSLLYRVALPLVPGCCLCCPPAFTAASPTEISAQPKKTLGPRGPLSPRQISASSQRPIGTKGFLCFLWLFCGASSGSLSNQSKTSFQLCTLSCLSSGLLPTSRTPLTTGIPFSVIYKNLRLCPGS